MRSDLYSGAASHFIYKSYKSYKFYKSYNLTIAKPTTKAGFSCFIFGTVIDTCRVNKQNKNKTT